MTYRISLTANTRISKACNFKWCFIILTYVETVIDYYSTVASLVLSVCSRTIFLYHVLSSALHFPVLSLVWNRYNAYFSMKSATRKIRMLRDRNIISQFPARWACTAFLNPKLYSRLSYCSMKNLETSSHFVFWWGSFNYCEFPTVLRTSHRIATVLACGL